MSAVTDPSILPQGRAKRISLDGFLPLFLLTTVATLVMSLPNLADPMVRWDDFPALLGQPELFWSKTLHEGRWLNYVWHLRDWLAPAWVNFAIYQLCWAAFAAGLATVALGRSGDPLLRATLAIAIVVSPSALLISLWFNTLIPGLAVVALYAALACFASARVTIAALPVFVVVSFMAYTTYPLLLLAVCLVRQDKKSFPKLIGLLALFTLSIIAAVLVTYTLNWHVHGVFGVPLDDWRAATPADGPDGYLANLDKLGVAIQNILTAITLDFGPALVVHAGLFFTAAFVLLRSQAMMALYLYAGLFTGLCMVAAQILKLGVDVPARTFLFVWVFHWSAIALAARQVRGTSGQLSRYVPKVVVFVVGCHLVINAQQYTKYRPWQAETVQIAALLEDANTPIYVFGDPANTPAADLANIQSNYALFFRLQQLLGERVTLCAEAPDACAHLVDVPDAKTDISILPVHENSATAIIYRAQNTKP